MNRVQLSAEYFPNPVASKALSNANIYVGLPDTDPEVVANRKTISALQENGSIVAITQPVKTGLGGIPVYNGSPVTLLVDGQYSVKVTSSTGTQLYYIPANYQSDDSPVVKYVSDIASLRTTQSEAGDGETIYLVCHTTNGDGGHGTFYWDAASAEEDDGQDTIAVTGVSIGRWKRNIDPITGELSTHINLTTAHGSTDAPMPGSIVQRDFYGCSSFAPGTDPSHAVIVSQLAAAVLSQIVSSFEGDLSGTNSGWLKLPGGMIIQWGKNITASTENTWIVHDFPIPFPTTAFVIVGTGTDASVNLDPDIRTDIYGLGQFRIWNTGYTSKYVNWIALGYGAPSPDDYSDIVLWSGLDGVISGTTYTATATDYPPNHTASVEGAPVLVTSPKRVGVSALNRTTSSPLQRVEFTVPTNVPLRIGVWHYTDRDGSQYPFWLKCAADVSDRNVRLWTLYQDDLRLTGTLSTTITEQVVPGDYQKMTWRFFELVYDPPNRNIKALVNGDTVIDYVHGEAFPTESPIDTVSLSHYNTLVQDYNDNLIVSTDITRDLYALALLEASPRVS